ncbi:hypothetical protein [Aquabacter sediminis]|uniref:hypothetical protein n=1 Tax=Aquabacter sediminis TaxID=3029197 RepID=UPI00237DEF3D|nr:hypothetical protein [Aquabacter sp. P-9]MDE1569302.1 hypothetical protein [Aquabacter sp. P-9]
MSVRSVWIASFAVAGLSCLALPAFAQEVPPGSYLESCREVRVVAGWLRASCQDRSGRWVEATTAPGWCSPGNDIANEDGRLVCKSSGWGGSSSGWGGSSSGWGSSPSRPAPPPPSYNNDRPPPGSYMASCRDIRVSAGWLKATCQDSKGRWVDATTAVSWCSPGRDIANIDGRLTCR